jgi:hypothetical protein
MRSLLLILTLTAATTASAQTAPPVRGGKLPPGAAKRAAARNAKPVKADDAPAGATCISGFVYSLTFSVQYLTQNFADLVLIGDTYLCPNCDVKPPIYGALVQKLETAYDNGTPVDACYDGSGYVTSVRIHNANSQ